MRQHSAAAGLVPFGDGPSNDVLIRVLGQLEASKDGHRVDLPGGKQAKVLALLVASLGDPVAVDVLVDEVYGSSATSGADHTIRTYVSNLRRALGDVVERQGSGYAFTQALASVDASWFEDALERARLEPDPQVRASLLNAALSVWRGEPYAGLSAEGSLSLEAHRLSEMRRSALEARLEADLDCGRHLQVVPELETLTAEHPLSERVGGLLMLALYRSGRQADALDAYRRLRGVLVEELGIEPSQELRDLEEKILLQDASLMIEPRVPNNLPAELTSFVGRQEELGSIDSLLAERRLVTLIGPGGSGKTRLALRAGSAALSRYRDGVWLIDLRDIDNAEEVPSHVASVLRIAAEDDRSITDQVVHALHARRPLLIVDNCEHVLAGVRPLLEALVSAAPDVRVLATSRETLGLQGEWIVPVGPLPVPTLADSDDLLGFEAAQFFDERACQARSDFSIGHHAEAVAEICRACEGLPLALELAAARLHAMSPEEIAGRLDDELAVLRSRGSREDERHATIEAAIRWSWNLLDDEERLLFGRLSVFRGPWSLGAAEEVCGSAPLEATAVFDLVGRLVDKSLITVEARLEAVTYYRLLEPIRQFAAREVGDATVLDLRKRFISFWLETRGASPGDLRHYYADSQPVQEPALELDQPNLIAAVDWALELGWEEEAMLIFAGDLGRQLMLHGTFPPVERWLEVALENRDSISRGALISAIGMAGEVAGATWHNEAWMKYAKIGLDLASTPVEEDQFDLDAGVAANRVGKHDEADAFFDRLLVRSDNPGFRATALISKTQFKPPVEQWELMQRAMQTAPFDSLGFVSASCGYYFLSGIAGVVGRYDVADEAGLQGIALAHREGFWVVEGLGAADLADVYMWTGRIDEAARLIDDVLPIARGILGPNLTSAYILRQAATVARLQGRLEVARSLIREAWRASDLDVLWVQASQAIHQEGLIKRDDGDLGGARDLIGEAIDRLSGGFRTDMTALARMSLAGVEIRDGRPDRAGDHLLEGLDMAEELWHFVRVDTADLAATTLASLGRVEPAATITGAVDHERETTGMAVLPPDVMIREDAIRQMRTGLGDRWESTVAKGREMTLHEAAEFAASQLRD